jgi:hypothetical protein
VKNTIDKADRFARRIVDNSTSVGQVYRALPFIKSYLDEGLVDSLGEAERRSRMPRDFTENWEFRQRRDELHNALAMGHLITVPDWDLPAVVAKEKPRPEQP